jgi:hypothetical protein
MLQTCDVRFRVEEEGRRAPDVGCCTQHESQHGRNMGRLGVVPGRRRGGPLMLDVAHNMLATFAPWTATCSQHLLSRSQHACIICSLDRNMLATFAPWTLNWTADD